MTKECAVEGRGTARPNGKAKGEAVEGGVGSLVHRDGHQVRFLEEGTDKDGEYLLIEHVWARPGPMAGPHWHPVLTESFAVEEGTMRFRVLPRHRREGHRSSGPSTPILERGGRRRRAVGRGPRGPALASPPADVRAMAPAGPGR